MERSAAWLMTGSVVVLGTVAVAPAPRQSSPPTYHRDIAPMFQRSCLGCHSQGGSAPFALETYEQVVRNIELVRIQTLARSMPPMFARSDFGSFSHRVPLSDEQLVTLQRWYQAKLPEGQPVLPPPDPPERHVEPDFTVRSEKLTVRPEGPRYWMVYALDLPAGCESIDGFTFVPKSPKAVRQATVAVVPSGLAPAKAEQESTGSMGVRGEHMVGAWAPGYDDWALSKGFCKRLPAGGKLFVQVLYQPTGKPEDGGFEIGFRKAATSAVPVETVTFEKPTFLIEPFKSETFSFDYRLKSAAAIHSVVPEARFFAGRIKLTATLPSGDRSTVFETVRWDPYWIGKYQVPTSPVFPAGTWFRVEMEFNNDERCLLNAEKEPVAVRSGPRLEDEVCRFHLVLQPVVD